MSDQEDARCIPVSNHLSQCLWGNIISDVNETLLTALMSSAVPQNTDQEASTRHGKWSSPASRTAMPEARPSFPRLVVTRCGVAWRGRQSGVSVTQHPAVLPSPEMDNKPSSIICTRFGSNAVAQRDRGYATHC